MVKNLRSLIHEKIPFDLRVDLEFLSRRRDLIKDQKQQEILTLFRDYGIEVVELGPGTNRYTVKINGFAVKIATDDDGRIDNLKEFKMAKRLYPYVTKIYEVSQNGTLLVAEYVQPFGSFSEMCVYADKIREILRELSAAYLIGDVGVTSVNYSNWGTRIGSNEPVCLDFAYIYAVRSELFMCNQCKNNSMLVPTKDFTDLQCPSCKTIFEFSSIRAKIGNDPHRHEIGDLTEEGYLMERSNIVKTLDTKRSNYLLARKEDKKSKNKNNIMSEDSQKEETDMSSFEKMQKLANEKVNVRPRELVFQASVVELVDDETPVNDTIETKAETCPVAEEIEPDGSEVIDTVVEVMNAPESGNGVKYALTGKDISNLSRALSKLSNKINSYLREYDAFDMIRWYMKGKKVYPEDFYKPMQNCIFRSLAILCHFVEKDVPSDRNNGTRREFVAPDNIAEFDDSAKTVEFIRRFWMDRDLNSLEDADKIMPRYRDKYNDEVSGIQRSWLPILRDRMNLKLRMDSKGVDMIIDFIAEEWCEIEEKDDDHDDPDPNSPLDEDGEEIDGEDRDDDSEEAEDEDIIGSFESNVSDMRLDPGVPDEIYGDNVDDEVDEDPAPKVCIEIYPKGVYNTEFDIIKLYFVDELGENVVPFYTLLDKIDADAGSSIGDERNGHWNWLTFLDPATVFETDDPEKWLKFNTNISAINTAVNGGSPCFVIIDKYANGKYVMGGYIFQGIYLVDENGICVDEEDPDVLCKLNKLFKEDIACTSIDKTEMTVLTRKHMNEDDVIEYLEQYIAIDYPDDEPANENDVNELSLPSDTQRQMNISSEAEDAAIRAMLSGIDSGEKPEDIKSEGNNEAVENPPINIPDKNNDKNDEPDKSEIDDTSGKSSKKFMPYRRNSQQTKQENQNYMSINAMDQQLGQ